jgi:MFS family permease
VTDIAAANPPADPSRKAELARTEWKAWWPLPFVAALGGSATSIHIYSMGSFFQPLQDAFHWTRAEVSIGTTVAIATGAVLNPVVGTLIDRFGPRRVGLIGIVFICAAVALLGTATGTRANWIGLWLLVAAGGLCVQPMVWAAAVASRFNAARGLAVGITLCGPASGIAIFPPLSTWLIEHYGWRMGFIGLGAIWAALLLPLNYLYFRGAADGGRAQRQARRAAADVLPGLWVREALRTSAFYKLALAATLFTFTLVGITVHLVPILVDGGITRMTAASFAGIGGLCAILGRLGTGYVLDRFQAPRVAAAAMVLPISGCALLLIHGGWWMQAAGAILIGFAMGAEFDLVTYLATRHFGLRRFGVLFGIVMVPMASGTATGPLVASTIHDKFLSYDPFLWAAMPMLAIGALLLTLLGPFPRLPVPAGGDSEPPPTIH